MNFLRPTPRILARFAGALLAAAPPAAAVEIVAHRGGSALGPENTLAAFRTGVGFADRIEFDVRTTADGQLVLLHDDTVDRTTDGTGPLAGFTLAQLKQLDAGVKFSRAFAGERIPTLAETLNALPPATPIFIDAKLAAPAAVAAALRAANAIDRAIVAYGGWNLLEELHRIEPRLALSAAGSDTSGGPLTPGKIQFLKAAGVGHLAWDKRDVTPEFVALVHANGLKVHVAVAESELAAYAAMGVDALFVADPRAARAQLSARPAAPPAPLAPQPRTAAATYGDWFNVAPAPARPANEPVRPAPPSTAPAASPATPPVTAPLPSASPRHDFRQGLVAYWRLDDGRIDPNAVNAADELEHSPGRLVGYASDPGWLAGPAALAGGALSFNGDGHYVRIPPTAALDVGTNALSLSLWVKLAARPADLSEDFSCLYGSDSAAYMVYLDKRANELRFRVTDAAGHSAAPGIPADALQVGVWHHVAGVYDGAATPAAGHARIFLDGQLRDTHVGADILPGHGLTASVLPGQYAALGRLGDRDESYFAGALDDVALWRRPLAPAETLAIYARGQERLPLH